MRSKHLLCVNAARDHTLVLRENVLCGWLDLLTIRDRGIRPRVVFGVLHFIIVSVLLVVSL